MKKSRRIFTAEDKKSLRILIEDILEKDTEKINEKNSI